jgi:hypothetical protein
MQTSPNDRGAIIMHIAEWSPSCRYFSDVTHRD